MNFYRRFPGDYIRDTLDHKMVDDGAYTRLLDWQYSNEKPIANLRHAYDISRAKNRHERDAVRRIYSVHFKDGWNPRVKEELTKAESRRQHAKNAINTRWERYSEYQASNTPSTNQEIPGVIHPQTPDSRHQTREVFKVEAAEESSTNTVENNGKPAAAAAALISIGEIRQAFDALSTRPFGDEDFQVLFALATRNFRGSWVDVMEGTILAAQNAGVTVPREFFLIKREVEQIEVKNSFKRTPL